ncbi:hypothetical protein GM921_08030 [Pedobacter sp. LMG 31464]|uniref:Uncharacterized protein n=1 Tax=Pedobacter planticolens TaxID=2679964 RepID=A0A923DWT7_9SPHI|nr:hypothetical protein [Pedobacter planticolens]MBB2145427.1 hypothetical protein [Pedobacter planticolens]
MKKNKLLLALWLIPATPILMLIVWFFMPKTKLVVAIVDKTVLTSDGQEHISLDWVLNQEKYTKTSEKRYKVGSDYYGFFPKDNEKFRLKGLERFSPSQLEQLSEDANLAYFTDTYGIYKKEWYNQHTDQRSSGILYGGLSTRDLDFLELMKAKRKLIITEFNTIGSPTSTENRNRFEQLFGMHWTGWTARFFNSLDTAVNTELPIWLVRNYKAANGKKWPFKRAGIAFVSDFDQVVILEDTTHLSNPLPYIISSKYGQEKFSLPEKIKYPFWFDVIVPNEKVNQRVADFKIYLNQKGKAELKKYGIPESFPAVLMHNASDYQFYYFSGDFCDNPISMTSSYFKGIGFFKFLLYDTQDPMERKSFFWNFYRPMLTTILKDEVSKKR